MCHKVCQKGPIKQRLKGLRAGVLALRQLLPSICIHFAALVFKHFYSSCIKKKEIKGLFVARLANIAEDLYFAVPGGSGRGKDEQERVSYSGCLRCSRVSSTKGRFQNEEACSVPRNK